MLFDDGRGLLGYTGDEQGDGRDGRAGNYGNGSGSSSNLRNVNDDRRLE